MTLNADTVILASAALAIIVFVGLLISLWRGMSARRALRGAGEEITERDMQLQQLLDTNQQLQQAAHEDELQLGRQDSDIENLQQRLGERDNHLSQHAAAHQSLSDGHSRLRDTLAQAQAENRGQSVALEQEQLRVREKSFELSNLQTEYSDLRTQMNTVLKEHAQLQTQQAEREDRHLEQIELLNETRENLKKEFENLANKIFEDKGKSFTTTSQASMEAMLKPFREQITGFQTRIDQVHSESLKGNTVLEMEIKKVLDIGLEMNTQASNLSTALKGDKKTAGNWGEAQLERTLELAGLQAGEHYDTQAAFRDDDGKRKLPDFVIKLPDSKSLIIDSKVSLVDYDRAIAAETDEQRTEALNAHARAVRDHIDDLSTKDYSNIPDIGSPDFVLMFMPIEPAYIEAMKHNKDLFNYGYTKGVVMVSHTTLMPILRTVANLWMVEQSNREAKEIGNRAGDIYNQVCLVAERLQKLGNTLKAANNHYNDTVKGLVGKQGLHGKVDRFQQVSTKANRKMAALEPIHDEIETDRLDSVNNEADTPPLIESPPAEPPAPTNVKSIGSEKKS